MTLKLETPASDCFILIWIVSGEWPFSLTHELLYLRDVSVNSICHRRRWCWTFRFDNVVSDISSKAPKKYAKPLKARVFLDENSKKCESSDRFGLAPFRVRSHALRVDQSSKFLRVYFIVCGRCWTRRHIPFLLTKTTFQNRHPK